MNNIIQQADAIRVRFQTHQLTVCREVSAAIEAEMGFAQVKGLFLGVHPHCWNLLEDGRILDATFNQFGDDPVIITEASDKRYVAFTEKHLAFIDRYTSQNYGRPPGMEEFLFMDEYMDDSGDEDLWPEDDDQEEAVVMKPVDRHSTVEWCSDCNKTYKDCDCPF